MMALDQEWLRGIGELLPGQRRPLRKREQLRAGNMRDLIFLGLAHVDETRRMRRGEPHLGFRDGNLGDGHARQFVIETGVPTLRFSKNFFAMNPGMRMQPCEAGYPGRKPSCIPVPPTMRMK